MDSLANSSRLPDWQIPSADPQGVEWLGFGWGLNAIDVMMNPALGVSETWWRVFKAYQTSWSATIGLV